MDAMNPDDDDAKVISLTDQIWRLTVDRGMTPDTLRKWIREQAGKSLEALTVKDCKKLLEKLL